MMKANFSIGGITFDTEVTLILILGTILPMLDWYGHSPAGWLFKTLGLNDVSHIKAYDRIIFYLIIPLLVIVLILRDRPAQYGFQIGDWREGLKWVAIGCIGMTIILWFVARSAGMQDYYVARAPESPLFLIYITGVDLLGWEFIWRGLMLFALAKTLGPGPAIFIQAIPFAFMHLGKPEIETLSTIFGGAAFGFVAWRSGSFAYPFLIHWYIASFTQLIALGRI